MQVSLLGNDGPVLNEFAPPFRVETWPHDDQDFYVLDVVGSERLSCTCRKFQENGHCYHQRYMEDALFGDGKETSMYWLVKSAYHKELRRGDMTKAMSYARLLKHFDNNSSVKRYVFSIILEETRNIDLLDWANKNLPSPRSKDAMTWEDFTAKMVTSVKKWEIPATKGMERVLVEQRCAPKPNVSVGMIRKWVKEMSSIEEAYYLFPWISGDEQQEAMSAALLHRLRKGTQEQAHAADVLETYYQRKRPSFNCFQAMIDFLFCPDTLSEGAEYRNEDPMDGDVLDFYWFRPRVFDKHTRRGISLLKADKEAWWRGESPEGVDIRWSGNQMGNLWRHLAFHHRDALCDEFGLDDWRDLPFKATIEHEGGEALYWTTLAMQARKNPSYHVKLDEIGDFLDDPPDLESLVEFDLKDY